METRSPTGTPTGRVLARGVIWIGLFRWSAQLLSWAAFLVVIHKISPGDYGIAGLALALVAVASVVSELGIGTAIIAQPNLLPSQVAQLNVLAIAISIAVAGLILASAPLFASFFSEQRLTEVFRVLSLVFLAEGARVVPVAVLSRNLRYRLTASVDFAKAVVTSIFVLALALAGKGYWALVIGNIAGSVFCTIWICAFHGVGFFWPQISALRKSLRLGLHIVVSRLSWTIYRNSDFFVAGRMFGSVPLGQYTAAWNLASLPGEKLGNVLTSATQSFFAAVQHQQSDLRRFFLGSSQALAFTLLPLLVGLIWVADLAVPVVLGPQWVTSIGPLRWLIIYAAANSILTPVSQVINVTGNTGIGMIASLISLFVLPVAFAIGGHYGALSGIAAAWVVTFPLLCALPLRIALRALDLRWNEYISIFSKVFESVAVMSLAVVAVRVLPDWHHRTIPELVCSVTAGAATYAAMSWARQRDFLLTLFRIADRR
jgi:O-antigen/teichoic acid export membrane protein